MQITVARVLISVAITIGALAISGCGTDTSSPENVVEAYHEALKDKDLTRMKTLLCKEDMANWKDEEFQNSKVSTYETADAVVNGMTATLEVTYFKDGKETLRVVYWCLKEGSEWKLALIKTWTEDAHKAMAEAPAKSSG